MNDSAKIFIEAVADMRNRQKSYFKTRSREDLLKSKEAEKSVDDMLITLDKFIQAKLF